jgi:hypothetical protein
MNPIRLGWIDYSSEHRNKVLAVLDALSAPEAVDELGIGLIRDGFADILFPGTSTIQTRAKYFFIVPYLLMELEKESLSSPGKMMEKLKEEEISLIQTLNKDGVSGVIGARAGKKLKRRPSSIYWNGLRTFEFFKHETLSLDNYVKAFITIQKNKHTAAAFGHEGLEDTDLGLGEYSSTFWRCLIPEGNWKEHLSIELSRNEATYLKDRIIKANKSNDSMFAYLLKQEDNWLNTITNFEEIDVNLQLPEYLIENYTQAKKFSEFISGANIRYNMILSNFKNKKAADKWEDWLNSFFVKSEFQTFPFHSIIEKLKIKNPRLVRFLTDWKKLGFSGNDEKIDQLLVNREIELKSKGRAKLNNSSIYAYKDGDWVGSEKLSYRFHIAKALSTDIYAGLEEHNA